MCIWYIPSLKVHPVRNVRLCVMRVSHGASAACCCEDDEGHGTDDLPDDLDLEMTKVTTALMGMRTDLEGAAVVGYC